MTQRPSSPQTCPHILPTYPRCPQLPIGKSPQGHPDLQPPPPSKWPWGWAGRTNYSPLLPDKGSCEPKGRGLEITQHGALAGDASPPAAVAESHEGIWPSGRTRSCRCLAFCLLCAGAGSGECLCLYSHGPPFPGSPGVASGRRLSPARMPGKFDARSPFPG